MKVFEKLTDSIRDGLYLNPTLHLEGNKELIIENCRRIEEYNEVYMRIVSGALCIHVWGNDLRAFDYKSSGLIIRGRISQIEFEQKGGSKGEERTEKLREDKR